jgi:hypothetical protein
MEHFSECDEKQKCVKMGLTPPPGLPSLSGHTHDFSISIFPFFSFDREASIIISISLSIRYDTVVKWEVKTEKLMNKTLKENYACSDVTRVFKFLCNLQFKFNELIHI